MENNQKSVATLRCVWQAIKENYGTILLVSCIIASIVLLITGCDNGDGAMMALAAVVADFARIEIAHFAFHAADTVAIVQNAFLCFHNLTSALIIS